jgi:hypothetical protein
VPDKGKCKAFYGHKKMCWSKTPQRRLRRLVFCGSRAARIGRRSSYRLLSDGFEEQWFKSFSFYHKRSRGYSNKPIWYLIYLGFLKRDEK